MILNYSVIASVFDKVNKININFTESIDYHIEDIDLVYNKEFLLISGNILDVVDNRISEYLVNNAIALKDIEIKDISIETDNIDFEFIVNKSNAEVVNFEVEIYAYYKKFFSIPTPILVGEAIGENSLVLKFNDPQYAHKIYDENNNIVGMTPIWESEYIEENLSPGTTYCRKVVSYNTSFDSEYSNLVEIATHNHTIETNLSNFNTEYEKNNNIVNINLIDEGLNAFNNGIGYSNDLKIYKPNEVDYVDSFDVTASIYGKYTKTATTFQKASFDYRIVCIGKYDTDSTEGFVRFKIKSDAHSKVKIRVYRYAYRSINIEWMASAWISYKDPAGGVNKILQISLNKENYTLNPSIKYNGSTAYIEPQNNLLVKGVPLKRLITDYAQSRHGISSSSIDKIFDYNLFDNCSFDRYNSNSPWEMKVSSLGTFSIHTMDKNIIDENSNIYGSGYSNAQLYDVEEIIEKEFYGNSGSISILSKDEINAIVPTNVDDRSEVLPSNITNIVTKVEVISVGRGITVGNVNLNNSVVLPGTANLSHSTPELQYKFDNSNTETILNTSNLLSNNIDKTIDYEYTMNILGCTNNISLTYGSRNENEANLIAGQVFNWGDTAYSNLHFVASKTVIVNTYEDILPAYSSQAYHGVINGVIGEDGECQKKDMVAQTPMFSIPQNIYDVRFKIMLENINPYGAHVDYKFFNRDETGDTKVNGDYVLFTSEASKKIEQDFMDLLSVQHCDNLNTSSDNTDTVSLVANIQRPVLPSNNKYSSFVLKLETTATDVVVDDYNEDIRFDHEDIVSVPFKAKVRKNATAKWCPLIKNGYYYLNQHEYYLYSKNNIDSSYEDTLSYYNKNSTYKVLIEARKTSADINMKVYSLRYKSDYIIDNEIEFNNFLYPKASVDGIYYKEYRNVESIIKEIQFDNVIYEYNYIKWDLSRVGDEVKLYVRSFNIDTNDWNDWVLLSNNAKPNIPVSFKIQLKASFTPKVEYKDVEVTETVSSFNEFYNECDQSLTQNIYLLGGGIQANESTKGIYFSKILKFETSTRFKLNSYYTIAQENSSNSIAIYVAASDDFDKLQSSPNWVYMDGITSVTGKYIRYRIDIGGRVNVVSLYKEIKTRKTTSVVQGLNNIQASVKLTDQSTETKNFYMDKSYSIAYDKKEKIICYNLLDEVEYYIRNNGYTIEDVTSVEVQNDDEEITMEVTPIDYNINDDNIIKIFEGWGKTEKGMNYWTLDDTEKSLTCSNASSVINSFITPKDYKKFRITTRVSSSEATRNPIGILLGYEKDYNDFEHTLTLLVGPSDKLNSNRKQIRYSLYYNYNMNNEELIFDGNHLITEDDFDTWSNCNGIYIDVEKNENIIKAYRSQNDRNIVDSSTFFTVDINDYPKLMLFSKRSKFGFCTYNQNVAKFTNLFIHIDDMLNSMITAKTNFTKTYASNSEYIEFENNKAIMSPIPEQYSPITIEISDGTPLKRVYFTNGNKYVLYNIETFTNTNNSIRLTYTGIDFNSIQIYINDEPIDKINTPYEIINNYIFFDKPFGDSDVVKVIYKIANSFVINYSIEQNEIEVELYSSKDTSKAMVKYETNNLDSRRRIEHLSLNPIYNSTYDGFIYLTNEISSPSRIDAYVNPNYVDANGEDHTTIIVKLTDVNENPTPGEYISAYCDYGILEMNSNTTDANGIVSLKYHSSTYPCIDNVKIINDKNNLSKTIIIENLEV